MRSKRASQSCHHCVVSRFVVLCCNLYCLVFFFLYLLLALGSWLLLPLSSGPEGAPLLSQAPTSLSSLFPRIRTDPDCGLRAAAVTLQNFIVTPKPLPRAEFLHVRYSLHKLIHKEKVSSSALPPPITTGADEESARRIHPHLRDDTTVVTSNNREGYSGS